MDRLKLLGRLMPEGHVVRIRTSDNYVGPLEVGTRFMTDTYGEPCCFGWFTAEVGTRHWVMASLSSMEPGIETPT